MPHSTMDVEAHGATGLSVEDRLRDIYEAFRARRNQKSSALEILAAAGATDNLDHPDDDLIYHEDPYLQSILGSSGKN